MPVNDPSMTPTIEYGSPRRRMLRPRTDGVAAEITLPQPLGDDDVARRVADVVGGRQRAAETRLHAEHGEVVPGDHLPIAIRTRSPPPGDAASGVNIGV